MKIKQVVIVEGKTDSEKLKNFFGKENVDTIETNGLALSEKTLNTIKEINEARGVIVFTDPDGPGLKIRDTINKYLNFNCFNAFINKKNINSSKKIGIAEADDKDIIDALNNLIIFNENTNSILWKEFLENDFYKPENRRKIAAHFNWSEKINSKKLFQWLNYINLSVTDVKKILGE